MKPKTKAAEEKPVTQTVKLEQALFVRLKTFSAETRRTNKRDAPVLKHRRASNPNAPRRRTVADTDFSKTAVYESLAAINRATDQLAEHIERLKSAYRLKFKLADLLRFTAEELRAQINHSVVSNISRDEMADAGRFQKQRTEQERKIMGE